MNSFTDLQQHEVDFTTLTNFATFYLYIEESIV